MTFSSPLRRYRYKYRNMSRERSLPNFETMYKSIHLIQSQVSSFYLIAPHFVLCQSIVIQYLKTSEVEKEQKF